MLHVGWSNPGWPKLSDLLVWLSKKMILIFLYQWG